MDDEQDRLKAKSRKNTRDWVNYQRQRTMLREYEEMNRGVREGIDKRRRERELKAEQDARANKKRMIASVVIAAAIIVIGIIVGVIACSPVA